MPRRIESGKPGDTHIKISPNTGREEISEFS